MVHAIFGQLLVDNMNQHGDARGNHGDQTTEADNHASQHEYNYFLDREIQNKLLVFDEARKVTDWTQAYKLITCSNYNYAAAAPPPKAQRSKSKTISSKATISAWGDDHFASATNTSKPEVTRKPEARQSRMSRDKESVAGWKDTRMRDISYVFKHYGDCAKYIEQYRYEHTYNLGPLGREPIEITTCKIVPVRDSPTPVLSGSDKHHQPFPASRHPPHPPSTPPPNQHANQSQHNTLETTNAHVHNETNGHIESPRRASRSPSRPQSPSPQIAHAQSEPNILDLAHKYKFAPSALKDASSARQGSPTSSRPNSRLSSAKTRTTRPGSGSRVSSSTLRPSSGKSGGGGGNGGGIQLAPSLVALGTIGETVHTTAGRAPNTKGTSSKLNGDPPLLPKRHSNDSPLSGPIYTKVAYRSQQSDTRASPDKAQTNEKYPHAPKLVLAPNSKLKTLDLITTMTQPQETQNEANDSEQNTRPPPTLTVDSSVMSETTNILKQGTDRDHFKNLVSELSYLNINPVDENTGQIIPLDVTGLTVSFAQKYDIRELGFGESDKVKRSNSRSSSKSPLAGRSPRGGIGGLLPNIGEGGDLVNSEQTMGVEGQLEVKATPRTLRIQLERVRDQRREKQQTTDVHKKQIKWRLNKMQKEFEKSMPNTPNSNRTRKQILDQEFNRKLDKQRTKVSFKLPVKTETHRNNRDITPPPTERIINGNDAIELPVIPGGHLLDLDPIVLHSSRPASPGVTVSTPDKATLMRRYFMDVAAKEGDGVLMERLRHAPDRNFKPASANCIPDPVARKYVIDEDEDAPRQQHQRRHHDDGAADSAPVTRRNKQAVTQRNSRSKVARSKTFVGVRATTANNKNGESSSHVDKLHKLREIYMKQKASAAAAENGVETDSENNRKSPEKGSYKASVNVLQKMKQGSDDANGVRSV